MGKIEFPRFDGTNLKGWLFKVEEFFGVDSTPEHLKGKMAAIHFDGQASTWALDLIQSGVGLEAWNDWKGYVKLLREQFEDDCDDDQPPNGEFGESIEHPMVKLVSEAQEENPKLENHEGWEQIGILEVEGDVERDQKMISDAKTSCAHKVFDKMSQHQESLGIRKKKKGLKSWMFKYKKGNKKRDLLLLNGKDSLALRAIGTGLETVERDSSNQEKSKLGTEDKGELKGCLERLQGSALLKEESDSMVVNEVKAEFKTFDRKRNDRILSLEDKQDDEHEQNQVIKLISSLKNRIWEPGGVLIEHDRWKDLENCYKHGRLMRLMQPLSSMWWQLSKSRELERLGACSFVDTKTWLDLCSREYKNHMLLLDYHGMEMQVLSCLLEIVFRASMSMESKARLWIRDIECIRKETVAELMQTLGETGLIMKFPSKVKDALDGLVKVGFKIQGCSGFDLETWIGLEVYGWEYKKQISIGHINLYGMCNELAYDKDKKKERNIEDDVKKEKNRLEGKIILAVAVKEYMMGKVDEMLLPGHYGLLHTFDQCGGLNATVIAGTTMQSSLKLFHQLRVACPHHTSLGFLYGSLPRPPEENHSNFSNMLQYHETWSCILLRTNRVWDPGGSNFSSRSYIGVVSRRSSSIGRGIIFFKTLRSRFLQRREI